MTEPARILVVDDDPGVRQVVRFALTKAGFGVIEAADGAAALRMARSGPIDLVVLDINMPELSGMDVCRELRRDSTVPIVFLSSADDELDRVLGLELGGDDYVTKPFSTRELTARVRAVLRRAGARARPEAHAPERLLEHAGMRLDLDRCVVSAGAATESLTATELGILRTLMRRPGKVYSRDELMTGAYDDFTVVSERTIDSHMRRVRRKLQRLGLDPIETVHGLGYRLRE